MMAILVGGPIAVHQDLDTVLVVISAVIVGLLLRDVLAAWQKPEK